MAILDNNPTTSKVPLFWEEQLPPALVAMFNKYPQNLQPWIELPETVALRLLQASQDESMGYGERALFWVNEKELSPGISVHIDCRLENWISVEGALAKWHGKQSVSKATQRGDQFEIMTANDVNLKYSVTSGVSVPKVTTVTAEEQKVNFVLISRKPDQSE